MKQIYQKIVAALQSEQEVVLVSEFQPETGLLKEQMKKQLCTKKQASMLLKKADAEGSAVFLEPVRKPERLIICGGGHIAAALADMAAVVGFEITVLDSRPEFVTAARFPKAQQRLCGTFEQCLTQIGITAYDYVVIVTSGHRNDGACLTYLLDHQMPHYVGMIGSRRRVSAQFELFVSQGYSKKLLDQVCTPVGIPIGAVTPQEIAVSILAELISFRRDRKQLQHTDLDLTVIRACAQCTQPASVVTILKEQGSSPCGFGAKMLVYRDGSIAGTIGGGSVEAYAITQARKRIGTGRYAFTEFAMNADVAAAEGMACGGKVWLLIEDLCET